MHANLENLRECLNIVWIVGVKYHFSSYIVIYEYLTHMWILMVLGGSYCAPMIIVGLVGYIY